MALEDELRAIANSDQALEAYKTIGVCMAAYYQELVMHSVPRDIAGSIVAAASATLFAQAFNRPTGNAGT